jgi:glyceraldehyde-3-phosphate dehydrogenase (NADP+)
VNDTQPIYVAGRWEESPLELISVAPGTGEEIGRTFRATAEQLERATEAAVAAFETTRRLASFERSAALHRISEGIVRDREALATSLAREAGKPLGDAFVEVDRTSFLFRHAAEEAERIRGELVPLDLIASSRGKFAITRRVPLGPVAGISPFNVPLSLAAHKVAPAIAAGDTIVLKPDSRVALTLLLLARIIDEAGLPAGTVSVLPMDVEVGDRLVTDPRFRLLSFTGSARVGWDMRARAGTKNVVLELGGDGAVIVAADADLDVVLPRLLVGSFKYAGQICISVQRVFAHRSIAEELQRRLIEGAEALRVGPPLEPGVDLGPMISEDAAVRTLELVDEAVAAGARLLTGGTRDGAYVRPTVLTGVPGGVRLAYQEAFAPVVVVEPFDELSEAIERVNASDYGLQAGVFTSDLATLWEAFEDLEVGGVVIGDVPTYRIDHMPYGGVKESGVGREGIRYAIEHMTELRSLIITPRP